MFARMKGIEEEDQGKEEIDREETGKGTDLDKDSDEDTGKGKGISGISNSSDTE